MFEFDDEIRWILGRPNFSCAGTAGVLRKMGRDIPNKAEDEQAATIYFYLEMYEKHGKDWRTETRKILQAVEDK